MAKIMIYIEDKEDGTGTVSIKAHPPIDDIAMKVRRGEYATPAETYAIKMANAAMNLNQEAKDTERASRSGLILPKG